MSYNYWSQEHSQSSFSFAQTASEILYILSLICLYLYFIRIYLFIAT